MSDPTSLDLTTTDDLIDELMRRSDYGVISLMMVTQDNHDGTGDNYAMHVWKGNGLTCAGLAAETQYRILRARTEQREEA